MYVYPQVVMINSRPIPDLFTPGIFTPSRRVSFCWIPQMLMIAERTGDALIRSKGKEMMEEMAGKLANVIEDFLHAVEVT